jgi:hypothetical protein
LSLSQMAPDSKVSPPPTLSATYAGIPERLAGQGHESKQRLLSKRTLPESVPRKPDVPRLPPDTTRAEFDQAIRELEEVLGAQHVAVNDQPLVDGWYVEHP